MRKIILIAAVLPFVYSNSAMSSCEVNVCQGHAEVVTPTIKADRNGVFVQIQAESASALNCQLKDGFYARLDEQAPQFDLHRSLLMTAIASQSDIRVEFDEGSSACLVKSVELSLPH